MKFFLFSLTFYLLALFVAQAQPFYVDPATGNDANSGSINLPFKTITKAISTLDANLGTIYLRAGVYISTSKISLTKSGQENNRIKIWAYPGEKVVFDFSGNTSDGFSISGNFYHLKGIWVKNAGHNGINISGSNNIIENCAVFDNKNTGLHLTGSVAPGPSNNLILNCDAFCNYDPPIGGNADGFSAKWTVGPGNIFKACRAWNNSDDGWDLWMATSTITLDSCWAFRNGVDIWFSGSFNGNGNGIKLGGNNVATPHIVRNSVAFDNPKKGFDENNNLAGQTLYNCTGFRNGSSNFALYNNTLTLGQHVVKNCVSYKGKSADNLKNTLADKNSWQLFTLADADFQSLDTAGVAGARDAAGDLPKTNFLRPVISGQLVNAGVDVGIRYFGLAPDLGAFEYIEPLSKSQTNDFQGFFQRIFPNPATDLVNFHFNLAKGSKVVLKVFSLNAREICTLIDANLSAGPYEAELNTREFEGGVYFIRLNTDFQTFSNKFAVVR
jgi:hypothetical protein